MAKQDFTATAKIDTDDAFRLARKGDFVEFGSMFAEAFTEAMISVREQMERRGYHPDKSQLPHLSISFTSTGLPNG